MVRPGMLYMLYGGGKIELSDSTYQKMDEDFWEVITCAQKFIKLIWLTVINTKKSFVMKYNEISFTEFSESIKRNIGRGIIVNIFNIGMAVIFGVHTHAYCFMVDGQFCKSIKKESKPSFWSP